MCQIISNETFISIFFNYYYYFFFRFSCSLPFILQLKIFPLRKLGAWNFIVNNYLHRVSFLIQHLFSRYQRTNSHLLLFVRCSTFSNSQFCSLVCRWLTLQQTCWHDKIMFISTLNYHGGRSIQFNYINAGHFVIWWMKNKKKGKRRKKNQIEIQRWNDCVHERYDEFAFEMHMKMHSYFHKIKKKNKKTNKPYE